MGTQTQEPTLQTKSQNKIERGWGKSRSSLNRLPQVQLIFIRAIPPSREELVLEFSPEKRN